MNYFSHILDKLVGIITRIDTQSFLSFDKIKNTLDQKDSQSTRSDTKGVFLMSVKTHYMPSFLEEFRSMKLEMMIRDLSKLSPDELLKIRQEIDQLLHSELQE